MDERCFLEPEIKKLSELRGIEEISLSFETKKILQQVRLDKVIVHNNRGYLELELTVPEKFTANTRREIEKALSGITGLECKIKEKTSGVSILETDWSCLLAKIKEKLPAVYGWLSTAAPEPYGNDGLRLKVTGTLAIEFLKRREEKLQDFFRQETGKRYFFSYEVVKEERETPNLEEKMRREALAAVKSLSLAKKNQKEEVLLGKKIRGKPLSIKELPEEGTAVTEGKVFKAETRSLKSGKTMSLFMITDFTSSLTVKIFPRNTQDPAPGIKEGLWLRVRGKIRYDEFQKEPVMIAQSIQVISPRLPRDEAEEKRVELHLHTKMSAMDSVVELEEAVKLAASWGHTALAVTDHGVVQAFPEAAQLAIKYGLKIIYGMEGYLVNDEEPLVANPPPEDLWEVPLVIPVVKTVVSGRHKTLSEFAAIRVENGEVVGEFTGLEPSAPNQTETTAEIPGGDSPADRVFQDFLDFAGNAVLVVHPSGWDFLASKIQSFTAEEYRPPVLDILNLCRTLRPHLKNNNLKTLAGEFGVTVDGTDKILAEAEVFWKITQKAFTLCREKGITGWRQLDSLRQSTNLDQLPSYHILLLVRNMTGLSNLYRLVSESHLRFFRRHPRIPKSLLAGHREGLLLGTACESGELFSTLLKGGEGERIKEIVKFYDFLEIQPLGNNDFLLREGKLTREELMEINRHICRLGEEYNKPVVATGDVHFLRPDDEVFRRVLMAGQGYNDADRQAPLYFRSTEEMLAEFSYLSPETARKVVVENPAGLAESMEELSPVPEEFSPPEIPGAGEEIRQMAYSKARELYGDPLPSRVREQLEWELKSIIEHGYAVIFLIAHKLVKKSLEDGYLVGSRGSVGSSLVATMCGITKVNPLPAHYLCPNCRYCEFPETGRQLSGIDLPPKDCPECGTALQKDGHDIPFATFMGFEGDKEPDIDLNFSGEYQAEVHRYTEELFGKDRVFRAGTISTLAEKTAFGFVRGYVDERSLNLKNTEINRLVKGCSRVKRTTGQHPGGMMVVPAGREIYDFTPVQYPANDREAEWITTHFDYRSLSGRMVKLDILGHDDPTVLKMLSDLTGINPSTIPLDDPPTMKLFSSAEPLGLNVEELGFDLGTLGIPEFGTEFVRQMLAKTKPSTFSELVYISGLSHGTGVWLGNAQELIEKGVATLSEVISTRDDIMNYLIHKGIPPRKAFGLMEQVRKGKGLSPGDIRILEENAVPDWYIEACRKIKYMFPKAHAVAYVMMAFRIAYFKVHHPEAFYASYFTVRADEFDAELMLRSTAEIQETMRELKKKGNEASAREKNLFTILEIVREALLRGIRFLPVDLYQSDPVRFLMTPDGLRVPLVSLPGLGENAAWYLEQARREKDFFSVEDLKTRAHLSSAVIDVLEKHGCLKGLPAKNQLSLF